MNNCTTVVGLDVHKDSIVAAVLPPSLNRPSETLHLENQPKSVEKLAKLYRSGELTAVHVPTMEWEAARDLVRSREASLVDWLRSRHRLGKFLLRQGQIYRKTRTWGHDHREWLKSLQFEWPAHQQTLEAYRRDFEEAEARLGTLNEQLQEMALQGPFRKPVEYLRCFKGINTLSALTFVVEVQEFRRFPTARAFMSYTGLVSSEHSSGSSIRRGSITKVGNAHVRRVLIEAAWRCRHGQGVSADSDDGALGVAGRAEPSSFAGESHEEVLAAIGAAEADGAESQDPALDEPAQMVRNRRVGTGAPVFGMLEAQAELLQMIGPGGAAARRPRREPGSAGRRTAWSGCPFRIYERVAHLVPERAQSGSGPALARRGYGPGADSVSRQASRVERATLSQVNAAARRSPRSLTSPPASAGCKSPRRPPGGRTFSEASSPQPPSWGVRSLPADA
ncbi:MAG: transposase [Elusimicrobia bacterium]|nr:transposase [Elusimicrobiota bacterium]